MKQVLIIAGEASGDLHGSALMRCMKILDPDIEFRGIGGSLMIAQGLEPIRHVRDMNFMGLVEVIRHIPFIRQTMHDMQSLVDSWRPALAILIDYPGFNLRFAPFLNRRKIPVMYYISPQLWAWHKSRVELIRRYVDRMVVLFEFERSFYRRYGVEADFVGHPLLDAVRPSEERASFRNSLGAGDTPLIGLLPGSRPQEVERMFPPMVESVRLLKAKLGKLTAVAGCAPELDERILSRYTGGTDITILRGKTYDIMAHSDALAVTSGTATLEAGILGTPMVVVYRTSLVTYLTGRMLVDIANIGLINIVAGARVVPELWQNSVTPGAIAGLLYNFCSDSALYNKVKHALAHVKVRLGESGASERAAKIALDILKI